MKIIGSYHKIANNYTNIDMSPRSKAYYKKFAADVGVDLKSMKMIVDNRDKLTEGLSEESKKEANTLFDRLKQILSIGLPAAAALALGLLAWKIFGSKSPKVMEEITGSAGKSLSSTGKTWYKSFITTAESTADKIKKNIGTVLEQSAKNSSNPAETAKKVTDVTKGMGVNLPESTSQVTEGVGSTLLQQMEGIMSKVEGALAGSKAKATEGIANLKVLVKKGIIDSSESEMLTTTMNKVVDSLDNVKNTNDVLNKSITSFVKKLGEAGNDKNAVEALSKEFLSNIEKSKSSNFKWMSKALKDIETNQNTDVRKVAFGVQDELKKFIEIYDKNIESVSDSLRKKVPDDLRFEIVKMLKSKINGGMNVK